LLVVESHCGSQEIIEKQAEKRHLEVHRVLFESVRIGCQNVSVNKKRNTKQTPKKSIDKRDHFRGGLIKQ